LAPESNEKTMRIHFIGYGRLAKSIIATWQKHHQITVSSPSLSNGHILGSIQTSANNTVFLAHSEVIILAVKPKIISTVLQEIKPFLNKNTMIISLAAGFTLEKLKSLCPGHSKIMRAMPNIAAEIGHSSTLMLGPQALQKSIQPLFLELGPVHWVEQDDLLDMGTILAGSGPAYVFYLMRALQEIGVDLGMPEALSKMIVQETFLGASLLSLKKSDSLYDLQQQVTSPQGTTAAALEILASKKVASHLKEAIIAAWQRIQELRAEIE
jgi:pyrroline-5-carboxylate reductase